MKRLVGGGTCVAAVFAMGIVALAQTPSQTPSQPQSPTTGSQSSAQRGSTSDQTVTISGCVQREADYRSAQNLGKGGAVGTGAGAGNEFVLIDASSSSASSTGTSATGASSPGTSSAGTAGTAGGSKMAYELTGSNEGQVASFVGKRVEITGKIKAAETGASGATGGPTAGAPPRGVDVAGGDLKLRELEVTSVREGTGSCPSASAK